jgi:hypothetical protein
MSSRDLPRSHDGKSQRSDQAQGEPSFNRRDHHIRDFTIYEREIYTEQQDKKKVAEIIKKYFTDPKKYEDIQMKKKGIINKIENPNTPIHEKNKSRKLLNLINKAEEEFNKKMSILRAVR